MVWQWNVSCGGDNIFFDMAAWGLVSHGWEGGFVILFCFRFCSCLHWPASLMGMGTVCLMEGMVAVGGMVEGMAGGMEEGMAMALGLDMGMAVLEYQEGMAGMQMQGDMLLLTLEPYILLREMQNQNLMLIWGSIDTVILTRQLLKM